LPSLFPDPLLARSAVEPAKGPGYESNPYSPFRSAWAFLLCQAITLSMGNL